MYALDDVIKVMAKEWLSSVINPFMVGTATFQFYFCIYVFPGRELLHISYITCPKMLSISYYALNTLKHLNSDTVVMSLTHLHTGDL